MRVDLYTKTVLTVIAVCLVWLCARDLFFPARVHAGAQTTTDVVITGIRYGKDPFLNNKPQKITDVPVTVYP